MHSYKLTVNNRVAGYYEQGQNIAADVAGGKWYLNNGTKAWAEVSTLTAMPQSDLSIENGYYRFDALDSRIDTISTLDYKFESTGIEVDYTENGGGTYYYVKPNGTLTLTVSGSIRATDWSTESLAAGSEPGYEGSVKAQVVDPGNVVSVDPKAPTATITVDATDSGKVNFTASDNSGVIDYYDIVLTFTWTLDQGDDCAINFDNVNGYMQPTP